MKRNSASRLANSLRALEQGGRFDHVISEKLAHTNVKSIPEEEKTPIAYSGLAVLQDLYEKFLADMRNEFPDKAQAHSLLEGLQPLRKVIYPTQLTKHVTPLGQSINALLDLCSLGLPDENEIPTTELDQIREGLQSLRQLAAKVKPAIRKPLLELIRICEEAVSTYEIRGAKGLREALKRMWGEMSEIWGVPESPDDESPDVETVWTTVKPLLILVDKICSKALQYRPLIEYVMPKLLTGPGPEQPTVSD